MPIERTLRYLMLTDGTFPTVDSRCRALFVTSELAGLAKTGGLGDVSAALPRALRQLDIDVRVLLPAYAGIKQRMANTTPLASVPAEGEFPAAELLGGEWNSVPILLVDCPSLYEREGGPYQRIDTSGNASDWPDNWLRFGLLSRVAALLGSSRSPLAWRPNILHCHDWQSGLTPAYLRFDPQRSARTLMTIHNLAFQGNFPPDVLAPLALPTSAFSMYGLEFHGQLSFLKAGLYYADRLSTVSPRYAREICEPQHGCGLEGLLATRRHLLAGILNGIDTDTWNPEHDRHLARTYTVHSLANKAHNKRALQQQLGLNVSADVPLMAMVSRLTHQKGVDLLLTAMKQLLPKDVIQLAMLGQGDRTIEQACLQLARERPGHISVHIGFDEALAHLMTAGADLLVMPSRFEPCGMNQMYAQRYGTPPLVRATGGLADSVVDCTPQALAAGIATGFSFVEPAAEVLAATLQRAITAYRDTGVWQALQRHGMARDFSWRASACRYRELYADLFPLLY